jgi:PhnB protein
VPENLPDGMPRIVPMLSYEDVAGAADWLVEAFGFRERRRFTEADGTASHVELELGDGLIMLGRPGDAYQSPRHHAEVCEHARAWSQVPYVIDGVNVYVDDVDAHCERARAAGATVLSEPENVPYGDRRYRAEDLEGHRWMFAQPSQ